MRLRVYLSLYGLLSLLVALALTLRVPAQTPAPTPTQPPAQNPAQTAVKSPAQTPAYASDPKFQAVMAEAEKLAKHRQFPFAAMDYKRANKLAGGECLECLRGAYSAEMSAGSFKDAAASARAMEALATEPAGRSMAVYRQASALFAAAGDRPKPEKLEPVHALLAQALAAYPANAAALYLDGKVLAGLGKMEEAKASFSQCVHCVSPTDPSRLRAEHFAENPELALHKMAPAFEVTALDGSKFNLDAMGGRVVLIDFWATWCGPCNRELPHMRQIAQEFAGQPLVILSVSWDADEAKWKEFVAKNGMTWMQYRDADHALSQTFGINAIPHYFTIDSDGVLTAELLGEGTGVEGKLKKLLAKAREARQGTVATGAVPAGVAAN